MSQKTPVEVLSSPEGLIFVAELAEYVTIFARDAYRGRDGEPDVAKLQAANETMHAITAKLVGLARGSERFPNEAFLTSIRERAGTAFGADLDLAIARALEAVSKSAARG
jgi:hypothetical protein